MNCITSMTNEQKKDLVTIYHEAGRVLGNQQLRLSDRELDALRLIMKLAQQMVSAK